MAASEKSVKLTKALDLIGVSLKEWNKTPEEKRGELFKSSMDKTLEQLNKAMKDSELDDAVRKEHEANISLIKEVSEDADLKKTEADIPLDPIMAPPEKKDLGGKSWQDIMNEFLALPTDEELAYYKKTLETIKKNVDTVTDRDPRLKKFKEDINKLLTPTDKEVLQAQREMYFAHQHELAKIKDPVERKLKEQAWLKDNGPMGSQMKDAVIANELRKHNLETHRQKELGMQHAPDTKEYPTSQIKQLADSADKRLNESINQPETKSKASPGLGGSAGGGGTGGGQ